MKQYDLTVVVGRFQPLHQGHIDLINHAKKLGEHTLILVGSSRKARDFKNPFSFDEREEMIRSVFGNDICIDPLVDDLYDDQAWVQQVQDSIQNRAYPDDRIAIVGHRKNDTFYLDWFPQYSLEDFESKTPINATQIRELYYNSKVLSQYIPRPVTQYIQNNIELLDKAADEYHFIQNYKKPYEGLPYKPIFVTVDAVVVCSGHVLLVKRKAQPGKGLFAHAGGFLNADEQIIPATIRELREETGLRVSSRDIKYTKVFDHPDRSKRGRTITHASLISLPPVGKLPTVKGGDDAIKAIWVPLHEFYDMSEQMFEDHWSIGVHMLRRT